MPFDAPDPRPHHYQFAHRLLPRIAFRAPREIIAAAVAGDLGPMLVERWDEFAAAFEEPDRLPADGLSASVHETGDGIAALVTFPTPEGMAEAYFAAVVITDEATVRYLTLENSRSFPDNEPMTVLGEWTVEGSHINLGPGPAPEPAAFLAAIRG